MIGRRAWVWVGVCVVVGVLLLGGLVSGTGRPAPRLTASASPLLVSVSVNPQTVSEGSQFTVTATVQGGAGPFTYNWNDFPGGCSVPGNISSWTCSLSSAGQFMVGVSVSNSTGASGSASASVTVTGNGNGNGGGSNGNNSNGLNLSGLGPIMTYALIAGITAFALLVALTVGVIMIAVTLSRRLPRQPRHGVVCASCRATAPPGSKFCPACAAALPPSQ